jgi:DNA-binding NarL/FixJ family response regulator
MPTKRPTRVALLYHDPLLRDIVEHVFGQAGDIQVVAELPAAELPLDELIAAHPDVVVIDRRQMDSAMPATLSAVLATLAERQPGFRVISLSLAEARVTVFSGWQMNDLSVDSLMACVRGVEPAKLSRPPSSPRPPRSRKAATG